MELALSWTCLKKPTFEIGIATLLLASSAVFMAACGSSTANGPRGSGGSGGSAGAPSDGGEMNSAQIAFVPRTDQISLRPKQTRQLTVQVTPAGTVPIRFALVGDDPADAVLDASEVETDAEGIARVTLTAPSRPAVFTVRASSTSASQVVGQGIIVSALGVTTLQVQPSYNGQREISEWTATTRADVSCSDLSGNPPPDGDRSAKAKPKAPLIVSKVPVGVPLAVTVRAGHYIGGCVNVPALSEGEGNQVLVYAIDRQLNLSETDLSLNLGATDAHPDFDKLMQESALLAEEAVLGGAEDDVAALLDGMRDATSAVNRDAFNLARSENGWDSAIETAFGKSAARLLRDPVQRWLSAGLLALNAPDAIVGRLRPLGTGVTLTPTAVGGAAPGNAGMPGFFAGSWSTDSNDTLLLGIDLNWEPSRLVTALAVAPAVLEFPGATSAENALALSVGCAQVGQVLLAQGVSPGSIAFASCDEKCAVTLCSNAAAAAWAKAQLSSGTEIATLSVTATGTAEVGDDAQATSVLGSWVGELRTARGSAVVSGALSASSTR